MAIGNNINSTSFAGRCVENSNNNKKPQYKSLNSNPVKDEVSFGHKEHKEKKETSNKLFAALVGTTGLALGVYGAASSKVAKAIIESGEKPAKRLFGKLGKIAQIHTIATTDKLTGLLNKRCLLSTLPKTVENSINKNEPLSLIFNDLDFFKGVNDVMGHDAGDKTLERYSGCVLKVLKDHNLEKNGFRFGGEEFVTILPGMDKKQATKLAQEISDAYTSHPETVAQNEEFKKLATADLEKHMKSQAIYNKLHGEERDGKLFNLTSPEKKIELSKEISTLFESKLPEISNPDDKKIIKQYIEILNKNPEKLDAKLTLPDSKDKETLSNQITKLFRKGDEISALKKYLNHGKMSTTLGVTQFKPDATKSIEEQANDFIKAGDDLLYIGKQTKRGEVYVDKD